MIRPLAVSFASLAMAITIVRGALAAEMVGTVIERSLVFAAAYAVVGGLTGWLLDTQIRSSVQGEFEQRVMWYREGMARWIATVHPEISPKKSELLAKAQLSKSQLSKSQGTLSQQPANASTPDGQPVGNTP
ncbi:MAG: hypothetical protein AAF958_20345 [Planctomycetota bacterium]